MYHTANATKALYNFWRISSVASSANKIHNNSFNLQLHGIKSLNSLPGPKSHPVVGNLIALSRDKNFDRSLPHKYWVYFEEKYGSMVRLKLPHMNILLLFDPDDFKTVLEATKDDAHKKLLQSLKAARDEISYFDGKTGIITEDGEEWWRVRREVQTPLMKPKLVAAYIKPVDDITKEFIERIEKIKNSNHEMPEDWANEVKKWAMENVAYICLNKRLERFESTSRQPILLELVEEIFSTLNYLEIYDRFWKIFPSKHFRKLKKAHEIFFKHVDKEIRLGMKELERNPNVDGQMSLLEMFLQNPKLSYKDVLTVILDLMLAGVENTYSTIGFCLYLLSKNPECQIRLRNEIKEVLEDREDITAADIGKMNYLRCVVKEVLRLFPVGVGVPRVLTKDLILKGYKIPKGQELLLTPYVALRKEKYFARPLEFIPDRWMRERPLGPIHPYVAIPFGVGTRMCIGKRILDQEIYLFLIRLMQKYNVQYDYQDFELKVQFSFIPSQPFRFKLVPCDKQH